MAYDGYIEYGGVEIVNLARTTQLCGAMGIDSMWTTPSSVAWIETALSGFDYDDVSLAPWYDAGHPASAEFAGIVPVSISGMDDSTREASTVEYITNGGSSNKGRNKTRPMVADVWLMASTPRGADYGKRWLDRVLSQRGTDSFCSGATMYYFQYKPVLGAAAPPKVHLRDVSLSRGTSVMRKRDGDCSSLWRVGFTWTANDPFEYGEENLRVSSLGGAAGGPGVIGSGQLQIIEQECPVFDYTPIYDPLHPALVAPPTVPNFYPEGWAITDGVEMRRYWARLSSIEPSTLGAVPMVKLTTSTTARYVRFSVWPGAADIGDYCNALWSVVVSYLPVGGGFYIDGEPEASYFWDGLGTRVRRTDSLTFTNNARPLQWPSLNDPDGFLVTLDVLMDSPALGAVRAEMSLIPKSD